uniref:ABC transporter substrate-binding protein n=1 Tax=Candidatus Methanomethylicus mesodigestus TaxID=1867258 RepID=A0A7C3F1E1_9CREN
MKNSLIVISIALIVVVGVAGLYFGGAFSPPPVTVRIGYLQGDLHQLALHVAISQGYFIQNGINYSLVEFPNGPTLMQSFVIGDLDFAYVGVPPAINARAKAMSDQNAHLPVAIASVNLEGSALVTKPEIQTLADLNNTRIGTPGTGTIQDILISMFAKQNNLTITKYTGRISELPIFFSTNQIDGFIGWEPAPSISIVQSNASVFLRSGEILDDHQCCVLVVSNKYLTSNPDVVSRMVKVHNAAMDFINSNPSIAKSVAQNYTLLSAQVIDVAFNDVVYSKTINSLSIKIFLSAMIDLGVITNLNQSQVDDFVSAFVDTRFIT